MKIYYPTYYVVPVVPVMFLDEDEYNTYVDVNKNIFEEFDEEYVNESTK